MAQQTINVGTSPNDGTGTPLRTAFQYTNSNFSELYTAVGPSGNNIVVPGNATITGDLTVDTNVLKVDSAGNRVSVNTTTFATDSAFAVKTTAGKFDVRAAGSLSIKLNSDQSMLYNVPTGNSHLFQINDSDAMTLNSTGLLVGTNTLKVDTTNNRVGIGTTSPALPFVVSNAGAQGFEINPNGSIVSGGIDILSYNRSTSLYKGVGFAAESYLFRVGTVSATDAMTLNSTGLGVGGVPSNVLTVRAAQDTGLELNSAASNSSRLITAYDPANSRWYINSTFNGSGTTLPIAFLVGNTERMRIDTSGNVGIGVTPSAWSAYRAIGINNQGFNLYSNILTSIGGIVSNGYYNGTNWIYLNSASSGRYEISGNSHSFFTAPSGTAGNAITFTQSMTLDTSGFLRLAASNASSAGSYWFQVKNTGASSNAVWLENLSGNDRGIIVLKHDQATGATSGTMAVFQNGGGSNVGSITSTNTATAYNIASDYRLKESVKTLSGGIARISALKPSIYKWKSDGSSGEGFLAHELAEVVPLAVTGEKDAVNEDGTIKPQQVDLSKVVPVLVAAIQELTARVQTLETR